MYTFTYTVLPSTLFANALPLFSGEGVGAIRVVAFFGRQSFLDSIGPCTVGVACLGARLYTILATLRLASLSIRHLLCATSFLILNNLDKSFTFGWGALTWHCLLSRTWLLSLVQQQPPCLPFAQVVTTACPYR